MILLLLLVYEDNKIVGEEVGAMFGLYILYVIVNWNCSHQGSFEKLLIWDGRYVQDDVEQHGDSRVGFRYEPQDFEESYKVN